MTQRFAQAAQTGLIGGKRMRVSKESVRSGKAAGVVALCRIGSLGLDIVMRVFL